MLDDVTVLDLASYVAGPAAGTVMGDYGANVIKVEPPAGDAYRALAARYRSNYNWLLTSRSKRSIALDLRLPEGQKLLHRLVEKSDVLIVNFNLSQLVKYQLNYEILKEINPRLILAQVTGYGNRGPEADRRAFDVAAWWARTGVMSMMTTPGATPPNGAGGVGDHATAMSLFGAIMMALYKREKTGKGSFVSSSLAANGAWSMGMHLQAVIAGYDSTEILKEKGYSPFTYSYETSDKGHLMLVGANPQREWPLICKALERSHWLEDSRFGDLKGVMQHRAEIIEGLTAAFAKLTTAQAAAQLDAVDATYSVVETIRDVVTDAQLIENDVIVATQDSDPDYQWTINSPIEVEGEPKSKIRRAPELGEHTQQILSEFDFQPEEILALQQAGVIER